MPNASENVLVATNGAIWVASVGAEAPSDAEEPMGDLSGSTADWAEMGFVSEDGATFSMGQDVVDIGAWQSFLPIRSIVTGRTITIAHALREWKTDTVQFALGGTVTDGVYVPPAPDELVTFAYVLEWSDGTKKYRLYAPKVVVTESVEFQLTRTAAADLAVTVKVLDPGSDESGDPIDAFQILTNDPAMDFSS